MKKAFNILGLLPFLLIPYFIFVHPAVIYYNTVNYDDLSLRDGKLALFYLALSILLWLIVFGISFYFIYRGGFMAKRNIRYLETYGTRVSAVIKEIKNVKLFSGKWETKDLILELKNFSHETILHKMTINDSRPQEKRFIKGKIIYLRVDPSFTKNPYVTLENIKSRINYKLYLIAGFLLAAVIYYYYYAYQHENGGYGWRFMELSHPLLLSPAIMLFFNGIIYLIVRTFIFNKLSPKEQLQLKFKGVRTKAIIEDISQTGTYINEQPQVKFTVQFTDRQGRQHNTSIKSIVSLLDIGKISQLKEREIIYLPDDPQTFNFTDEINN
ncbi:hypothetical protein [Chryseobacterium sp. CT-SW4]|uniref:hypothetical protein n=1 Tax=Chryseobacterium sp. SW-1 TaxID=3157343 RepID=UPI003B02905D